MSFLRVKDLSSRGHGSAATIWRKVRTIPDFPQPVKISAGMTGFLADEVEKYERRLVEESRKAVAA